MPRYRLEIEYDGRPFKGFQAQEDGLLTVQGVIETAIHGFCGETLRIHAAGRTDTGVHALFQVIHADLEKDWSPDVVRDALNAHLVPHPVTILSATRAAPDFHARFSATGRRYLYRILDRKPPPAIEKGRVWWVKSPLDVVPMEQAVAVLLGTHDFTTFRDLACQSKSPVKTLDVITVARIGEEVHLRFAARSFLHRQVRSITGSLAEVGVGRWTADDLASALAARDRRRCGPVAPAHGLYLAGVTYGPDGPVGIHNAAS
jgi:tRNA pseudouridine38-40 synthase